MSYETAERTTVDVNQRIWSYIRQRSGAILDRTAISDGAVKYTYGEMFRAWEQYAAVFSALNMTGANHARVGLLGSPTAEVIFSLYGLNMVGAEVSLLSTPCAFNPRQILQTIQEEKLTDIILTDDFAQPNLILELLMKKEALGLSNVLLQHVPVSGCTVTPAVTAAHNQKYLYLQQWLMPICMNTLLWNYSSHPISYASKESRETSIIVHTSGTTSGIGKPIPLSDAALNCVGYSYDLLENFRYLKEDLVCGVTVDLGSAYAVVNQVHAPLCVGGGLVTVPGNAFNPSLFKAVAEHGVTTLFCNGAILEFWMKQANLRPMDFSSLRCVVLGGSAVTVSAKHRYHAFLCDHGGKDIALINGYGLSEMGGACILSTPDLDDDSIGYAMPGVEYCLYDEDSDSFRSMEEIPGQGVLYLRSDAMTCGQLDGREFVQTEKILGREYICTNDYVRVDSTGKITYLGRANRYFINNEGIKYEAGRVETEVSRQEGIESCGVVPVYVHFLHDNIPMLCVKPLADDHTSTAVIQKALTQVFAVKKTLAPDQLPHRVMILEELPRNANGKIDLFRIQRGEVTRPQYKVEAKKAGGQITDIRLVPAEDNGNDLLLIMGTISKDIMENSKPFGFANNYAMEGTDMKQNNNPFAFFGAMNQANTNMMNMMKNMAPGGQQGQGWFTPPAMFGMPQMPQMPQMQQMQQMQQQMQQQMPQMMAMYMNQMYMMTKQMMETMYNQNVQMLDKLNEMVQKGLTPEEEKQPEETPEADEPQS